MKYAAWVLIDVLPIKCYLIISSNQEVVMATQGLVTIQKGGEVVMKIVAGSDGMHANSLVSAIRELGRVPRLEEAYDLAQEAGFGSEDDLVVVGRNGMFHQTGEQLPPSYQRTLHQPRFNPRWSSGTADFIRIVKL